MSNITYEVSGGIAVIKFNRPEKLNTLTLSMYDDLGASFIRAQEDPQVAVVILTGEGDRAFCVGADLTESIPYLSRGHYIDEWDAAHFKHIKMNKPVIAAVNGMCMGGGFEIMDRFRQICSYAESSISLSGQYHYCHLRVFLSSRCV